MKVQNISGELIILAGVKLQPQEICSVNDFDGRFFIPMFKEEFIVGLDNHTLQFLNEIGEIITDVNEILSYSENPIQSNSITLNQVMKIFTIIINHLIWNTMMLRTLNSKVFLKL